VDIDLDVAVVVGVGFEFGDHPAVVLGQGRLNGLVDGVLPAASGVGGVLIGIRRLVSGSGLVGGVLSGGLILCSGRLVFSGLAAGLGRIFLGLDVLGCPGVLGGVSTVVRSTCAQCQRRDGGEGQGG